jgi:hypothetical protein
VLLAAADAVANATMKLMETDQAQLQLRKEVGVPCDTNYPSL